MGNPQPSPKVRHLLIFLKKALAMDAVHRLDVGGWRFESLERTNKLLGLLCLRYSRALCESIGNNREVGIC